MEKGYRDYGHDMDNTDTLLEVGLGFTADYDKVGGFIGKEAVMIQREEQRELGGLSKRLVRATNNHTTHKNLFLDSPIN